jgi:hypothetical protein
VSFTSLAGISEIQWTRLIGVDGTNRADGVSRLHKTLPSRTLHQVTSNNIADITTTTTWVCLAEAST